MPPLGRSPASRAHAALIAIDQQGGIESLPIVLTSREVVPLLGRNWFMECLRRGFLPGTQVVPAGVWRCARETFTNWLHEVGHG